MITIYYIILSFISEYKCVCIPIDSITMLIYFVRAAQHPNLIYFASMTESTAYCISHPIPSSVLSGRLPSTLPPLVKILCFWIQKSCDDIQQVRKFSPLVLSPHRNHRNKTKKGISESPTKWVIYMHCHFRVNYPVMCLSYRNQYLIHGLDMEI